MNPLIILLIFILIMGLAVAYTVPNGANVDLVLDTGYTAPNGGNVNLVIADVITDTCTCPGENKDWEIDNSDSCEITTNCDLGTGTLNFTGTGTTVCNAVVNTTDLGDPGSSGTLQINSSCVIYIEG